MAGRLWVFDLDNTLVATSRSYGCATAKFAILMLGVLGWRAPQLSEIIKLYTEIDNKRTKIYGAARHRFPGSLVVCYRQLCDQVGASKDEEIISQVWQIGEKAFSLDFYLQDQLIPGVEKTLNFLKAQGDDLLVLTKGDPLVQWRKWTGYNLGCWFPSAKEFRVVRWEPRAGYSGDKGPALAELRKKYPERKIYMVGDSVDSDIIPAVEVGVIAIHIPAWSKWSWRSEASPLPEGVILLKKIADIIEQYESTL